MKDPYLVLGLTKDASVEELTAKYNELSAKYKEDRFLTGEAGNTAAKNLSELENAWIDIQKDIENAQKSKEFGGDLGAIDNLIKQQRYNEAQEALDSIKERGAEWHYLQSIIYYKREWLSESKAQLQMACDIEPWNQKYKSAYEKMTIVMGNPNTNPNTLGVDPNMTQMEQGGNGAMCGNACSNCCMAYCITDCCCTLTRCCG